MSGRSPSGQGTVVGQALRFLIVGGLNTLITYIVLVGLALVIPFAAAYAIAFGLGLVWTLFGTTRFVFRTTGRWQLLAAYLCWYLLVFGLGQLIIHLVHAHGFWPVALTSLVILAVTTPLNFVGGRIIFVGRRAHGNADPEG